jgi:hypothetical protein
VSINLFASQPQRCPRSDVAAKDVPAKIKKYGLSLKLGTNMQRRMIVIVHPDDDAKESRYLRHRGLPAPVIASLGFAALLYRTGKREESSIGSAQPNPPKIPCMSSHAMIASNAWAGAPGRAEFKDKSTAEGGRS